jgi:MoaA/NifB/PqqE/SkfB family radical SAM enzyme
MQVSSIRHATGYLRRGYQRERVLYKLIHGHPRWYDYPTTIQLDTHNFCNLACIYCNPQGSFKAEHGWMKMSTIEYILKYFSDRHISPDVVAPFMNGDSLLETRMPQITRLINQYLPKARVDVFTNGAAYKNRRLLVDPNINDVRFTISAASEKMYERIHGKPYFQRVLKTLKWTTAHKLPHQHIIINFVLTGYNVTELEAWKRKFSMYEQDIRPIHVGIDQDSAEEAVHGLSFKHACKLSCNPMLHPTMKFSEDRLCCCWHDLAISWDGHLMQCPDVSYECNYGKVEEVDILDFWRWRVSRGLDNRWCRACNFRDPDWRDILAKYQHPTLKTHLEAFTLGY